MTGMNAFRERPVAEAGGIAPGLQWRGPATDILLLDEPATFLDMARQLKVLQLLHKLNRRKGARSSWPSTT